MTEAGKLYPIALDVRGKRCVVVGGGAVGARKAGELLLSHAVVVVVAPEIAPHLSVMVTPDMAPQTADFFVHIAEPFAPAHLDNAFLAIAATDKPAVNQQVAEAARARGILLNLAAPTIDDTRAGDFVTMATVRRGDLLIAITTGGAGPALSAHLKRGLESRFGVEWTQYVALLGEMRLLAKQKIAGESERTDALRRLVASDCVMRWVATGDEARAREEALSCLFP